MFFSIPHSVNSKMTIHFYQILWYYWFIEHLVILFMQQYAYGVLLASIKRKIW